MNRFYSPQQGRFTQVDPIEMDASSLSDPQTLNLYSYCGNDPINHVDPEGLFFGKLFKFLGKVFKWIAAVVAVIVAVITIAYASVLFASTLKAVFGIISAVANATSSLLNAIGTKGALIASKVFGIIGAAADFATSLIEAVEAYANKGLKFVRSLLKAGAKGASLASKSLDAAGEKKDSLAFGLASTIADFIAEGLIQEIKDPNTGLGNGRFKWSYPRFWATTKFLRKAAEQSASLKGADKLAAYLNLAGIVDDVYDFTVGLKDILKPLPGRLTTARDKDRWQRHNTLKFLEGRVKNINMIVGRVNNCLQACKGAH